jgi:hypothetical protein
MAVSCHHHAMSRTAGAWGPSAFLATLAMASTAISTSLAITRDPKGKKGDMRFAHPLPADCHTRTARPDNKGKPYRSATAVHLPTEGWSQLGHWDHYPILALLSAPVFNQGIFGMDPKPSLCGARGKE